MSYKHGIYVKENATRGIPAVYVDSAVQVVIGKAPVNLVAAPVVNAPVVCRNWDDVLVNVGYSDDYKSYNVCEALYASFRLYNVAPVVVINVLDPALHREAVANQVYAVVNRRLVIPVEGVLIDTMVVMDDQGGSLVEGDDYSVVFDSAGFPSFTFRDGDLNSVMLSYEKLDPSAVTEADIIAAFGKVREIYPRFSLVPGLLMCPGYSHKPSVKDALLSSSRGINGLFNCSALLDIDPAIGIDDVKDWKEQKGYTDSNAILCYPMVRNAGRIFHLSAILGAHIAYVDNLNGGIPYVSPSNKLGRFTGTCLADGSDIIIDQQDANDKLKAFGVVTAINLSGWRISGSNTAIFPVSTDVKDRFIACRRMFDWWGNTFILTYFDKVDSPMNLRLIETVVDNENIRANTFKSRSELAEARIEFRREDNSDEDLLNGHIQFLQHFTPFPSVEVVTNVLEFDVNALTSSLFGGESL